MPNDGRRVVAFRPSIVYHASFIIAGFIMATAFRTDAGRAPARVSSEILDRLPPHNLDAEKGVLGSLLLDPRVADDVALAVRPSDFYSEANQKLFGHILAMHDEGGRIDATLLLERLSSAGDLELTGGAAYLAEIVHSVPHAANAVYYAEIVRDKATLRALIHASTEILRDAFEPTHDPREMVGRAEEMIFAVHDQRSSDQVVSVNDLMVEAFDRIDARLAGKGGVGVPSDFTDLDTLTGGLHESEFVVLAARPSMGKTALATNIAENVAIKSNVATLFVSLEMARLELAQRMLCSQGRIDASKFRSGFLSGEDRKKLVEASAKLGNAPLFIDDTPSRTCTEIAASARRLKRKANLGLVVIDYLQLIQPDDPRDQRQEQVAKMARRLKALARELKIPVLCLAQLNRQVETGKEGHRPKLSHLRESGAIEQDADVVMFVHREEYYHTREEAMEKGICG
ncbi:MAG: replicative DNA helicase, partial [Planctomycetaceae bacterium]|nr:replicative DNA helicase [Planctomycetaceae bacterium]